MNETKTGLLLRKAKKFFEQFPEKTSAIVKMKIGNINTHWGVQRKNGKYLVNEINSSKRSFSIKEDDTVSGKAKNPFVYDPNQKPGITPTKGTGTVDAGMEPVPAAVRLGQAAHAIRTGPLGKTFEPGQQPPPLPAKQQQTAKKIERFAGGKSHFDPQVIKKAAASLSDQEFGQFYGIPKKSLVKTASTPPPLPSRVAKAGMRPYGSAPKSLSTAGKQYENKQKKYRITLSEDIKGLDGTEQEEPSMPIQEPPVEEPKAQKTAEEKAISKLDGQTIKQATIEVGNETSMLSMHLAGANAPATLQWSKSGRIIFSFRGQNYVLKK